ncbi:OLD family endonuclease [Paraconexibacter algicola]|uniref:OLD family endonuclease n=2 Tax=Paraconexibacter algicola TaxID=2133960 RepID=A0A2T4UEB6_9ACTN|nr:OLD family endonuclease [Paraconexibacter algicola]
MRLKRARVQNYRSVRDSGWFDIEEDKTILVGSNEAGKTALLQALQQIRRPDGVHGFNPLRDYPRSSYNDVTTGKVDPEKTVAAQAEFALDADDLALLPAGYEDAVYCRSVTLGNRHTHWLDGGSPPPRWGTATAKEFSRMAAHADRQADVENAKPSDALAALTKSYSVDEELSADALADLRKWLDDILPLVDEENAKEDERHTRLTTLTGYSVARKAALEALAERLPVFVLFSNYFRVKPSIHLGHLAQRLSSGVLDDDQYDYGNQCLLKLLGFEAQQLSTLGAAPEPAAHDTAGLTKYKEQLDKRSYNLNAASVRLTDEIRGVWNPRVERDEADRLRVQADGQYLKVVVEDDLGVEIELDQRSEGFQWLVSFFVVFFAEAMDKHENAILLLDEPGLSLHGLKQRDFRETISRLAESNQTLYTTHSPFLVGPDELDLVRVVEMTDRKIGTQVHTTVTAGDAASLLPLQEALGYDLAQSLFTQQRNLVLEGLTDYWYLEATSELLRQANEGGLHNKIALMPADGASKVVYFATILHANHLKVAALLDSDAAGDAAAQQETLVHQLGNRRILRTKDAYSGAAKRPEIEDLLRETLIVVAREDLGWDVADVAAAQPGRPIVDVFAAEIAEFSKYKLAKAYIRWTREHEASELTAAEKADWLKLIELINRSLK